MLQVVVPEFFIVQVISNLASVVTRALSGGSFEIQVALSAACDFGRVGTRTWPRVGVAAAGVPVVDTSVVCGPGRVGKTAPFPNMAVGTPGVSVVNGKGVIVAVAGPATSVMVNSASTVCAADV